MPERLLSSSYTSSSVRNEAAHAGFDPTFASNALAKVSDWLSAWFNDSPKPRRHPSGLNNLRLAAGPRLERCSLRNSRRYCRYPRIPIRQVGQTGSACRQCSMLPSLEDIMWRRSRRPEGKEIVDRACRRHIACAFECSRMCRRVYGPVCILLQEVSACHQSNSFDILKWHIV
jgi:hypothetical protein